MESQHSGHLLSFRVMRLRQPMLMRDSALRLMPSHIIDTYINKNDGKFGDEKKLLTDIKDEMNSSDCANRAVLFRERIRKSNSGRNNNDSDDEYEDNFDAAIAEASCLGGELIIPSSFGNIYLGESFRGYISIVNHTLSKKEINHENALEGLSPGSQSSPSSHMQSLSGALSNTINSTMASLSNTNTAINSYASGVYDNVVNNSNTPRGGGGVSPGSLSSSMGTMTSVGDQSSDTSPISSSSTANNTSTSAGLTALQITLKAELHTERNRVPLYDSSQSPIAKMEAGDSTGFIVEHDIKETGTHTLVCSVTYSDSSGERRYMPQYFKFQVTNPLAVRTKVRSCQTHLRESGSLSETFLEVCVENVSKEAMLLESVSFEAAPGVSREKLRLQPPPPVMGGSYTVSPFDLLNSNGKNDSVLLDVGSSRHTLFRLVREETSGHNNISNTESGSNSSSSSTILGRVELEWRRGMGERGRLQTQQISSGTQNQHRDIEVTVVSPYPEPTLDSPFVVQLSVKNRYPTESGGGDSRHYQFNELTITLVSQEENDYMLHGQQNIAIGELLPDQEKVVSIQVIALVPGILRLTGLAVVDNGKVICKVAPIELFVKSPKF